MRTYAGPIVRVKIVEATEGGFRGTVNPDDDKWVYLAGSPECPPGYVSSFHEHLVVGREDYEKEDPSRWVSRIEKKQKKK